MRPFDLLAAGALAAMLLFPGIARAVDMGEAVLQSKLGEPLNTVRQKLPGEAPLVLKLSTELVDESRIGKLSAEERESLRQKKKVPDDDGQAARFMTLQHHLTKMMEQLDGLKLNLAQLSTNPPNAASSPITVPTIAESAPLPVRENRPGPAAPEHGKALNPPESRIDLPEIAYVVAGFLVAGLTLLLGLRIYTRIKSRRKAEDVPQQINKVRAGSPSTVASSNTPQPVVPSNRLRPAARPASPPKSELSEDRLIMEEAELYAIHGHPDEAVNILKEMIEQNPAKSEAHRLLLSIYSSGVKADEFEQAAREFQKLNPDSTSWRGIQALGRTLDMDNPLYADAMPLQTQVKRRPLGEILVEMGVLSAQDMKHCLAEFDPKKHGRFGGYLITHKVITLAQLDKALLKQQDVNPDGYAT